MDECEICQSQYGDPIATMTFAPDDTGKPTEVRVCRECLGAVFRVMVERWNESIAEANRSVEWLIRGLGINPADHGIRREGAT